MPRTSRISSPARARGPLLLGALPILFMLVFFAWPVLAILRRGLLDKSGAFDPLGTLALWWSPEVGSLVAFTLGQAAASTALTLAVGMPIAWLLARVEIPGRTLLRVGVTVPFVLPTVVVGVAFRLLLAEGGPFAWTGLDGTVWAILLAHAFFNVAVVARTVGGVWAHLDPRAEQAARTLGAGRARAFATVTLPALAPAIASAAAVVFLFCATSFGVVLVLGGTRYRTLETEIYLQTVQVFDLRMAAALSILQMLAVAAALAVGAVARRRRQHSMTLSPAAVTAVRPSGWQWLPVGAVLALIAALLLTPPMVMALKSVRVDGRWTLAAYRLLGTTIEGVRPVDAALTSLRTASDAAAIALVLGLLAAVALSRARGRAAGVADAFMMLPLGVSAVTVGFGLLITMGSLPGDLRSSPMLIAFAQALVAFPLVVRTLLPALQAIDQRLRQAAGVLGAAPLRVWWSVDLPLIARSLAASAGFAFVVALGEFGATSFLARPNNPTLPVLIGKLIGRPGADNLTAALACSVLLALVTAAVVVIIETVRLGDIGEF
ncbi:ABC transporter permease [Tomitella biformata]|uniref:ABC transporter permease n=1 Tax=Tomitella biformata TaxID=630403 RepID=UPI0004644D44|nr:iron ABC transporter permease [Tomitella biformata]